MKIGNTIYFDHQATTPIDLRVLAAMAPYLNEAFGNPHSVDHVIGWKAAQAVEAAASEVASLIGADPDEIVFTSGATEANNLALLGVARRAYMGKRKRILVSAIEHKCVLAAAYALAKQYSFEVELLPVDRVGVVDLDYLERTASDDVLVISIMAVNNEIGSIQPIEHVSRISRKCGAIFHCDGAQAPCAIDLSGYVEFTDMLSLSAHKMYGPKGIGCLFIRRELQSQIEPLIYGGGQQRNLRSGTVPVFLCVGMSTASRLISQGNAVAEQDALRRKRDNFLAGLRQAGLTFQLNGPDSDRRHPGNANLQFTGLVAHDILGALQPHLAASTGSACTSGIPEPSHVLRAIALSEWEANASVRFSLGRYTTDEDVQEAVTLVSNAIQRLQAEGVAEQTRSYS